MAGWSKRQNYDDDKSMAVVWDTKLVVLYAYWDLIDAIKAYGRSSISKQGTKVLSHPEIQVQLYGFYMSMRASFERYMQKEDIKLDYSRLLGGLLPDSYLQQLLNTAVDWAQTKGPLAIMSEGRSGGVFGI